MATEFDPDRVVGVDTETGEFVSLPDEELTLIERITSENNQMLSNIEDFEPENRQPAMLWAMIYVRLGELIVSQYQPYEESITLDEDRKLP